MLHEYIVMEWVNINFRPFWTIFYIFCFPLVKVCSKCFIGFALVSVFTPEGWFHCFFFQFFWVHTKDIVYLVLSIFKLICLRLLNRRWFFELIYIWIWINLPGFINAFILIIQLKFFKLRIWIFINIRHIISKVSSVVFICTLLIQITTLQSSWWNLPINIVQIYLTVLVFHFVRTSADWWVINCSTFIFWLNYLSL